MLVVYLALELLRDAVGELVLLFNPLSSFRVLDGHGCYACSDSGVGFSKEGDASIGMWEGRATQTPERTYDCGSQLLHQPDGGFHCAAGLDPLVNQQHLHTCKGETTTVSVQMTKYMKKTGGL